MNLKFASQRGLTKGFRYVLPLLIMGLCIFGLSKQDNIPTVTELWTLISSIKISQWLGALAGTVMSFWALGRYDAVAHRHLRTGLDGALARRAGMVAIAFSQAIGFGIFTGAFARWRVIPQLSPLQAAQMTAFVGVTFLTTLTAICGIALLGTAHSIHNLFLGAATFLIAVTVSVICFMFPTWKIGKVKLRLPSLHALFALSVWTMIDIASAGCALWLLLPEGHSIALTDLLPAYFLALGLAIISSAPGGAGPLEIALITLLPTADPSTLVAGLLAFRMVYYAVPAALSGLFLLSPKLLARGLKGNSDERDDLGNDTRTALSLPFERPQAETAVVLQNGGSVLALGFNQLAVLDSPQISVAFFDPMSGTSQETARAFARYAAQRNTAPCFYKCSPRVATTLRFDGWRVLRIAADAIVNPQTFSDSGSRYRQLRRKLRHAEKADLEIEAAWGQLPYDEMAIVDKKWIQKHGKALGTTMGRFEPGYVGLQATFLARQNGRLIGFVTFHRCSNEWALDLVRILPGSPDGTGHTLIRAAIEHAREAEMERMSLSAVPDHTYAHKLDGGLKRFKNCFNPTWEARYMATPSWGQMVLALAEMVRLIHRPAPLSLVSNVVQRNTAEHPTQNLHIDDEKNEFALERSA